MHFGAIDLNKTGSSGIWVGFNSAKDLINPENLIGFDNDYLLFPIGDAPETFSYVARKLFQEPDATKRGMNVVYAMMDYGQYCLDLIYWAMPEFLQTLTATLEQRKSRIRIPVSVGRTMSLCDDHINTLSQTAQIVWDLKKMKANALASMVATKYKDSSDIYQSLADDINCFPLHTAFREKPEFPKGFLNETGGRVKKDCVENLVEVGAKGWFARYLMDYHNDQAFEETGVYHAEFIQTALVVLLKEYSEAGKGAMDQIVNFGVGKDQANVKETAAVGLAHELIHAYHNAAGTQPGKDAPGYPVTLGELICVGLGPWKDAKLTENAIRSHWPPKKGVFRNNDTYNYKKLAPRKVYVPGLTDKQILNQRTVQGRMV